MPRIAVVGSSALDALPQSLYEYLLDGTPDGTTICLRRPMYGAPGVFERLLHELVTKYSSHLALRWCMPDSDGGRGATFVRDNEMVANADLVLAFFAPHTVMRGGTAHVVETAVDRAVPVYSYVVDNDGLARVGDHDPEALWQETLGAYF
jgi:hypothetical protein